jgi:tetratricopeptide (TPR) repeat protein
MRLKKLICELYQEAERLFLAGKIDEAIQLLNDEKLRGSVTEAGKKREEAGNGIRDAVQAWLLKAQLFTVQFRFEDAEKAYEAAIDATPDSPEASFAYARFNQELNRYEEARIAYHRCLEWARKHNDSAGLGQTLNDLGLLDKDENRLEEAREDYAGALQAYHMLAQKDPETYLPNVATTLTSLEIPDLAQKRLKDSRKDLEEALKIYEVFAEQNSEKFSRDVTRVKKLLEQLPK